MLEASLRERGDEAFWRRIVARRAGATGSRRRAGGGGPSILEIGCGDGRITEHLAQGAGSVVALDLSPDMLRRCRERTAGSPATHLVAADARTMAFRRRFDLIVAANDPLSHLTVDRDRDAVLGRVATHLAAGGRFVLDALWLRPERERRAAAEGGLVRERDVDSGPGPALAVRERWRCDPARARCTVQYRYQPADRPAVEARFEGRYWRPEEIRSRFRAAGLSPLRWWGDFSFGRWDPESSAHLVVEAGPA